MHCILRRDPRAPAHTRSLAIALQSSFYTTKKKRMTAQVETLIPFVFYNKNHFCSKAATVVEVRVILWAGRQWRMLSCCQKHAERV